MSTSDRTINQVRAILNKLDRSIDEARERRTRGPLPEPTPAPAAIAPPPPAPQPMNTSKYGRATPLNRGDQPRWGT
ncbi:MAG: hypothetical protein ACKVW3_16360 [Phycisphaerales bacterium]